MVESDRMDQVDEEDDGQNVYLTFELAGETYAVNIGYVTTIVGMQHISEIPDVPAFIKGAMNLRGKVIPVMDLRLRFSLPWREYDDRTTIIVLDMDGNSTGLVVDQVSDVVAILPEKIGPPPRWHGSSEMGVILGLGRLEERVSIILDIHRLLIDNDIHLNLPSGLEQQPMLEAL